MVVLKVPWCGIRHRAAVGLGRALDVAELLVALPRLE
jgi:hypothetical protein